MLGLAETGDSPPPQKAAEAIIDDRSGTAHRESLNDRIWRSGPVDADTARGHAPVGDGCGASSRASTRSARLSHSSGRTGTQASS